MKLMHVIVAIIVVGAFSANARSRLNDDKFQLLASACLNDAINKKGIKSLSYENAEGVGLKLSGGYGGAEAGIGFNIPRSGLNKKNAPGDGICCTFDNAGNIKDIRRTIKGNDECGAFVRQTNALGAGLWWCVGPEDNCHFDWWYIEP